MRKGREKIHARIVKRLDNCLLDSRGYLWVQLEPKDEFFDDTQQMYPYGLGWIREHRYVAAKMLGRPVVLHEVVHHIDGNKTNNSVTNLLITTRDNHEWLHQIPLFPQYPGLQAYIKELEDLRSGSEVKSLRENFDDDLETSHYISSIRSIRLDKKKKSYVHLS